MANLIKSAFIKNILIVMSGTALAQALSFALSPVISRLYSPSEFGVFGTFIAVIGIIGAGMTLDYNHALMLPKQKEDSFGLLVIAGFSSLLAVAFVLAICLIAPTFTLRFLKASNVWVLVLLVIGVQISGFNQAFQAWCIRAKAFKQTSAAQVIRSVTANGTQIGLGTLNSGAIGLIIAVVIGDALATIALAKVVLRDVRGLWRSVSKKQLWRLAKEYRDFPAYSATANVINALSLGMPVLMLTHFYGIAIAGAYAFGIRLIQAPMDLVLRALRQVLYQKAAETHNQGGSLMPIYLKITGALFIIGLLPSVVIVLWAPQIFSWVFGKQWIMAGVFARSLVVWLLFMFCNVPAILFTRILRLQRRMFFFDQGLLAARVAVMIIGGLFFSATLTVWLFSVVGAIMNIAYIVMIGTVLKKSASNNDYRGPILSPAD